MQTYIQLNNGEDKLNSSNQVLKNNTEMENEIKKESKNSNAVYFYEKEIPKFKENSDLNNNSQVFSKLYNEEILNKIKTENKFRNRNKPV